MLYLVMSVLLLTMTVVFIRLLRGKTIWDKLFSLNLFAVLTVMLIITYAVERQLTIVMDVAIAYSIIGFLALVLITRFIAGGNNVR